VKTLLTLALVPVAVLVYALVPSVLTNKWVRGSVFAALFGVALYNLHLMQSRTKVRIALGPDPTFVTEPQRQALKTALPAQGRVGYISDKMPWVTDNEAVVRYFVTQFDVAPVVVEIGTAPQLVVGNFKKFDSHSVPADLVFVRDFGGGVMLFQKRVE